MKRVRKNQLDTQEHPQQKRAAEEMMARGLNPKRPSFFPVFLGGTGGRHCPMQTWKWDSVR
jgi:hypothetical protein